MTSLFALLPGLLLSAATVPPAPAAAVSEVPAAPVITLKGLDNGDRACYVNVETAKGEQSLEGDFELCPGGAHDASALIGKHITYTTRKEKVLAAECQGDADCGKSDEVDLVVTITPAPK